MLNIFTAAVIAYIIIISKMKVVAVAHCSKLLISRGSVCSVEVACIIAVRIFLYALNHFFKITYNWLF